MQKREAAAVINISSIKAACKDCTLQELCLPFGLNEIDITALGKAIKRRRTLKKGEMLYRFGDPLRALYAIRSGALKTTGLIEDGRAQVTGFYLAGELIGIDAINSDRHPCSAEALESSEVCEIPYPALEDLATKIPGLQHQLLRIMSREIVRDEEMLMMLGRMSAEERLASCLVSFSRRLARLGGAPDEFKLSMSRQDLGDYLGLALETVSRLLSRFQDDGLINVHGRQIVLHDLNRLRAMAAGALRENSARA
ncbi:MAG: transcriptional regulator [Candidatus Muproteobacteria bacterium RIFCSPHIGHO2_12_FULL_60_33]|uniref:Transcriptional regulator n=1 Tax=Candidatus Muproteobacteria bacterium RIFCSPLOWO2_01_FULL_60_18 TaxID=1817768 RepID=A0A1F6U5Y7_9PROT|nr:MAG: transcriptional regulator [Candidatus Muproteobacteria bacterium RIFCSPHIGHO2_01_60_12]OGI52803.1 MAG: transcriptional regulator [Candidatus Muproteobacteria bacterium RIFCSPLOWO2_01_FULL_60_18]OGI55705.1 MAG: transcriptional regulator [Candidatus Muproteobacteria bacterium RIFCSPHIGHO2_12_FULL_60_33]OGI56231.1 MAG: transcriptional regulator [Candidatus Muproteobacteria bacterium RIFCSPHIGHO2_02_FULL_60_13]